MVKGMEVVSVGWKLLMLIVDWIRKHLSVRTQAQHTDNQFYALPDELRDMIWAQREFDDAVESDDIPTIVKFLKSGTDKQKADGAEAIWSLVGIRNINNKRLVREAGGIGPLIALVRSGTDVQKMWATSALMNLSAFNEENSNAIREAEGIEPLIALVRSGTEDQKDDAIGVLNNLSSSCHNQIAIKNAGGIELLITLVRSGTDAQKQMSVGALQTLAYNNVNPNRHQERRRA